MSFVRKVAKERAESTVQRNDAKPDEIDMVREVLPDVPSCSTDVLPDVPVRESGLGKVDLIAVENSIGECKSKRKKNYTKYSDEARYAIGKYASENGASATCKRFKLTYPELKESTVRGFKQRYEKLLQQGGAKSEHSMVLQTLPRGRPLMLGVLDEKIATYLKVGKFLKFRFPLLGFRLTLLRPGGGRICPPSLFFARSF